MTSRTKITNTKIPNGIYEIANSYGYKTIGSFYKFVRQCKPTTKLYLGLGHVRAASMLQELDRLLK